MKANFAEIEKEAEMNDQMKERRKEEARVDMEQQAVDEERKVQLCSHSFKITQILK